MMQIPANAAMRRISRDLRSSFNMAAILFSALVGISESQAAAPTSHTADTPAPTLQTSGNTIVITGGSSGIGRELALRFNDLGNTVIVTGRRLESLQETIAGRQNMHAVQLDVTSPESIAAFAQTVLTTHPDVNVLINNAGIMRFEDLTTGGQLDDAVAQITTNLLGPIRVTNALVEHLATRPNPVIVNVSSGLAFVPRADAPTYSATKAAVHAHTLSLRHQLQGRVKVIELIPPAVQTELTPGQSTRDGYMPLDAFIDEVMTLFLQQPTPDEIVVERAQPLRRAERDGRFEAIFERLNAQAAPTRSSVAP